MNFYDIAKEVLDLDGHKGEIGMLDGVAPLAYMIRRFGFPIHGSDSHKDLCAWHIETGIEGFYVIVRFGGSYTTLGWTAIEEIYREIVNEDMNPPYSWRKRADAWAQREKGDRILSEYNQEHYTHWLTELSGIEDVAATISEEEAKQVFERYQAHCMEMRESIFSAYAEIEPIPTETNAKYKDAYRDTLADLLKPILVRDVAINFLGQISDDFWGGEESDVLEPHSSSGYGVPKPFSADASRFHNFVWAVQDKGDGDFWKGLGEMGVLDQLGMRSGDV